MNLAASPKPLVSLASPVRHPARTHTHAQTPGDQWCSAVMLPPVATPGMTMLRVFPGSLTTFEFEQLVSQFWTRQLVDAVRNRVLVVERLTAGVHDGGGVQQGDVAFAVVKERGERSFIRAERKVTADRITTSLHRIRSPFNRSVLANTQT